MLCDRVIRSVDPDAPALAPGQRFDPLRVTWEDCLRRAFRATTEGGRSISVLLPVGVTLRHGDVLHEDDQLIIAAVVEPCEVIVATPPTAQLLGVVACELGNLHLPVEITDTGQLICLHDGPAIGVMRRCDVPFVIAPRRFAPLRSSVINGWTFSPDFRTVRAG